MLFNSTAFLAFAGLFFPLYYASPSRYRIHLLLGASYVFYAAWDWRFLSLILFSSILDFICGSKIEGSRSQQSAQLWLLLSCLGNLGVLATFKYLDFFISSASDLLTALGMHPSFVTLNLVLPVGISFYTFQTLSYSIDVYRGRIGSEKNFLKFATYVALFPQLVAGPIVRARILLPQLARPIQPHWHSLKVGMRCIVWGYFLKVVVADNLAPYVDYVFANPTALSSLSILTGALFFSFQIYCDFAGYSLIAIGLGLMLGLRFPKNFNRPYFARDFSEFWQRWHISLSSWLRDYLYISLGGNRKGTLKTYRNLILTMLLGGLWHGANYTFIAWGSLHGTYLVIQRWWQKLRLPLPVLLAIIVVYSATTLAWVYFRADDISTAHLMLLKILNWDGLGPGSLPNKLLFLKCVLVIGLVMIADLTSEFFGSFLGRQGSAFVDWVPSLIALWLILFIGAFKGSQFIYFQF